MERGRGRGAGGNSSRHEGDLARLLPDAGRTVAEGGLGEGGGFFEGPGTSPFYIERETFTLFDDRGTEIVRGETDPRHPDNTGCDWFRYEGKRYLVSWWEGRIFELPEI